MWKPVDDSGFATNNTSSQVTDNGSGLVPLVPFVQFRGDSHMVYYQSPFSRNTANKDRQRRIVAKARETRYTGEMSEGATKRLKKSLSLLIQAARPQWVNHPVTGRPFLHRVAFCTLTIGSQYDPIISIAKAKELFEDFLQWLYHTKGVRLRVWKVELQERGQPHFHVVFPNFIHYGEVRDKWNDIQRKHRTIDGYATRYKNFDPPSTEIKKAYQRGDIVNYLSKEMSKETQAAKLKYWKIVRDEMNEGVLPHMDHAGMKKEVNRRFQEEFTGKIEKGKIWDCSEVLSQTGYFTLALSTRQEDFFRQCEQDNLCKKRDGECGWWYLIKWFDKPPPGFFTEEQTLEYKAFVKKINDKSDGIEEQQEVVDLVNTKMGFNHKTGDWERMAIIPAPLVVTQSKINFYGKLFIDTGVIKQ